MRINCEALEVARKRNQMTWNALAEATNINPRELRRIRKNGEVLSEQLTAFATVLGFPEIFFQTIDTLKISTPTFRDLKSLTAKDRDAGTSAGQIGGLLWKLVEKDYVLPSANLPNYSAGDTSIQDGPDKPIIAAHLLREEWGLGTRPISNMIKLLELHGIRVLSLAENTRALNAYTFWQDGQPFVYLNTVNSSERSRFDAAHELGHLVLHRGQDPNDPETEAEANRFASAFLIPRSDLLRHRVYPSLAKLLRNKQRWNVSVSALVRAYRDNNLITEQRYKYLNIELSRKGWRKSEPLSSPRERSSVWEQIKKDLWSKGRTIEDYALQVGIPAREAIALSSFGSSDPTSPTVANPGLIKQKPQLRVV